MTITTPTSWNDCTPAQATALLALLQLPGLGLMEKRLSCFALLSGLAAADIQAWQDSYEDPDEFYAELDAIMEETNFYLEPSPENPQAMQLSATLTRCPYPELTLPDGAILYAPADGCNNLSAYELALLFDTYEDYARTPTSELADKLIAILYRKSKPETPENLEENWHGDRRQAYNEHTVAMRQAQIAMLSVAVKNAILFWFLSCRMEIVKSYPAIFKPADQRQRQGADFGWWGIFRQVAGNLADTERIAHLPWQEVLAELAFLEDERMREEMRRVEKM